MRFLTIFLIFLTTPAFAFGPQSSNKSALWGMDFVEEFDGLQTWAPNYAGCCGYMSGQGVQSYMPKLADGSRSAWVFYSGSASPNAWIGGTDDGKQVWRGTKAATIDYGGASASRGPSRLGIYFGDPLNTSAQPNAGYDDFSVFYMMWIPANHFPTRCYDGNTPSTTLSCNDGGHYAEYIVPGGTLPENARISYSYRKYGDASIGCGVDGDNDPLRCMSGETYGLSYTVFNIHRNNYSNVSGQPPGLHYKVIPAGSGESVYNYAREDVTILDSLLGGWMGFEFRIRNAPGRQSYFMDIWIYDSEGRVMHQMSGREFANTRTASYPYMWDYFVIGGNQSFRCDSTMDCAFHVDDFIVDGWSDAEGPIGPRYFAQIAAETTPQFPPNNITDASLSVVSGRTCPPAALPNGMQKCGDCGEYTVCPNPLPRKIKLDCTPPNTRTDGTVFTPLAIEGINLTFSAPNDIQSYIVPRCGMTLKIKPGTYKVEAQTCIDQVSPNGKCSNRSVINPAFVVPAL